MNNPEEPSGGPSTEIGTGLNTEQSPRFRRRWSLNGETETKNYNGPQITRCGRTKNWPPSSMDGTINLGIFLNTSLRYYIYVYLSSLSQILLLCFNSDTFKRFYAATTLTSVFVLITIRRRQSSQTVKYRNNRRIQNAAERDQCTETCRDAL